MPKRLPYLLTLFFGLLACYGFMAAKAPAAAIQYDYVGLTQSGNYLQVATVPDNLESIKVDAYSNFSLSIRPRYQLIGPAVTIPVLRLPTHFASE